MRSVGFLAVPVVAIVMAVAFRQDVYAVIPSSSSTRPSHSATPPQGTKRPLIRRTRPVTSANQATEVTSEMLTMDDMSTIAGDEIDNSTQGIQTCPLVADRKIYRMLLPNYSKLERPHDDGDGALVVTIGLRLFGIQDFIERESTLVLNAYLDLSWTDDYLKWNHTWPERCRQNIVLPADIIWLPDLVLVNSPDNPNYITMTDGLKITVFSDGTVAYSSFGKLQTICELDLTYFPFDRQICQIHFESWTYPSSKEHITHSKDGDFQLLEKLWTENKLWHLIGNYSLFSTTVYPDDTYDKVIFFLVLERKALFYYVNVIIPSIVIAIVELVTFFLPLTEVVKVHISFTCLLAYSVFQTMVIGEMPRSSNSVPLLCLYIDLQMSYIGLALIFEGVVFYMFENSLRKKEIPVQLLATAKVLAKVLLVFHVPKRKITKFSANKQEPSGYSGQRYVELFPYIRIEPDTLLAANAPAAATTTHGGKTVLVEMTPPLTGKERQEMWLFIADVLERVNLVTYLLLISITPGIMFGVLPYLQPDIYIRLQELID